MSRTDFADVSPAKLSPAAAAAALLVEQLEGRVLLSVTYPAPHADGSLLDTTPPKVIASSIQEGGVVPPGNLTYTVTFSEPMRTSNLDANDFTLTNIVHHGVYSPDSFSYNGAGTVLTIKYSGLPEDNYNLVLISGPGAFQDLAGNDLDGEPVWPIPPTGTGDGIPGGDFFVRFSADVTTAPFPTPLSAVSPRGFVYEGAAQGVLNSASDHDKYTVNLDPGQTAAVILHPESPSLQLTGQVTGPDGAVVAGPGSAAAGKDLALPFTSVTSAGTYTIDIGSAGGAPAQYTAELVLGATLEAESYGGASNDTPATAQSLDGVFTPLPGAAGAAGTQHAAVLGTTDTSGTPDTYALTLAAGQVLNLATVGLSAGGTPTLSLVDAAGNVLAPGSASQPGSPVAVTDFVAPAGGVYYAKVGGNGSFNYDLVALEGADIASSNHTLAAAQSIEQTHAAAGYLSGIIDYYEFSAAAGAAFTVSTATPGDGPGEPTNMLNPRIALYDSNNLLLASDDNSAPDRRNATLTYTPSVGGLFKVQVASSGGAGAYVLNVAGAVPLGVPAAPDLLDATDSGASSTDNITSFNNATPAKALQFSVGNTVPGATVTIYADGIAIGSATASGTTTVVTTNGTSKLSDGTYTVTARQTLPGRDESPDSAALSVTIEATPPSRPAAPQLAPGSDSGFSSTDGVTNVTAPTLYITPGGNPDATPGLYFRVYENGTLVYTTPLRGRTFTPPALANGTYSFTTTAVDAAGNESVQSTPKVVIIDTAPPSAGSLVAPAVTTAGGTSYQFTVTFSDNTAVDVASLGTGAVIVGGPVFIGAAKLLSVDLNSNGSPRTATYQILPPGGSWDSADNGTYTVSVQASHARDTAGNFVPAGLLGTFTVSVTTPSLMIADGTPQRSVIRSLTLTLPSPVTPPPGAFTLERLTTDAQGNVLSSTDVSSGVSWSNPSGDGRTFVASFAPSSIAADAYGSLLDGVYRLTLHAALLGSPGQPAPFPDQTFLFHRLFGDFDGNGTVNAADYVRFRRAFGHIGGLAEYTFALDYNGDDSIDAFDYAQFNQRFGTSLTE